MEERDLNNVDIIGGYRVQAERFAAEQPNRVAVFIGAGHRDQILNSVDRMKTATFIARNEPGMKPEIIDDLESHAAFLVAFAEELEKPTYNQ